MSQARKKSITGSFTKYCYSYHDNASIQKITAKSLIQLLPTISRPRILEIGCGTGILTEALMREYPRGIFEITDISDVMLKECKRRLKNSKATFFLMDGEKPLDNLGTYDLVVSSMTLHWFLKPYESTIRLSKLGPFFYATIGADNFFQWQRCLRKVGASKSVFPIHKIPGELKQEYHQIQCESFISFANDLRKTGAMALHGTQKKPSLRVLNLALNEFRKSYNNISWHITFGCIQ
jgi:malonyl-CoA O-methyltransferase